MNPAKRPGEEGVYQVMSSAPSRQQRPPTIKRNDIRGFRLVPNTVACEGTTTVTIVFEDIPESSGMGKVEVSVRSKEKTDRIEATSINRRTFCFTAPENLAGEVAAMVFVDGTEVASGRLTYRSEVAHLVSGVAQVHVQLLARLCRYLYVLQTNHQLPNLMAEVDQFLAQLFDFKDDLNQIEPKFFEELFGILRHFPSDNIESPHEFPTLLHLTAEFGFSKLTEKLTDLPEAERAAQVRNGHGYTSSAIARNSGHDALSATLAGKGKETVPAKRTDSVIGSCRRPTMLPPDAKQLVKRNQEEDDYVKPDSLESEIADTYGIVTSQMQTAKQPTTKPYIKPVPLNKSVSVVGKVPRSSIDHPPLPPVIPQKERESRDSGAYVDGADTAPPVTPRSRQGILVRGDSEPVFVGHSPRNSQNSPSNARLSEQDIRRQLLRSVPPQPGSKGPSLTK